MGDSSSRQFICTNPALLMVAVWLFIVAVYLALPFQLVGRTTTFGGYAILGLFVISFCGAVLLAPRFLALLPEGQNSSSDFSIADWILRAACIVAIVFFGLEILNMNLLDGATAAVDRAVRGASILRGGPSHSSLFFKIGFLTYSAGYVVLVREVGFSSRLNVARIAIFGALPVLMAALALGGRMPMLFALILVWLAYGIRVRRVAMSGDGSSVESSGKIGLQLKIAFVVIVLVAFFYFAKVFISRADFNGGATRMMGIATWNWGVHFVGWRADLIVGLLGAELSYLVFASSWYLVQGLIISNVLFSSYDGPMQFGVYGVDLVTALMRRLDWALVAGDFRMLLDLRVYGFFPSAFGSLFVDIRFWGLALCGVWGLFTGVGYQRFLQGRDLRWQLAWPFLFAGILTSPINTPIGFTNGLMTFFWLGTACLVATFWRRKHRPC